MAESEEERLNWEWFNRLYRKMNPETGVQFDPESIDYNLADQSAGRDAYTEWGNPPIPDQRLRSKYAQKLKMQQKLADELRNQGVGAYLPGGEFATEENTK